MAPNRGLNGGQDFDEALASAPEDFDPEEDHVQNSVSDDDVGSSDDDAIDGARDHYINVEKSKIRKPKTAALGPQYRGSKVSRDALTDEEGEDDPFSGQFGNEDSEEEKTSTPHRNGSDGSSVEDEDTSDEIETIEDGTSNTDLSDDEITTERPRVGRAPTKEEQAQLRVAVSEGQKSVASSLAQSAKADAEKGRAVQKQQAAFDSLLNIRIKLQKALVGSNSIVGTLPDVLKTSQIEATEAIEAADAAAFKLWSSLNALRDDMIATRTGQKRKRSTFTSNTPSEDLWTHMQTQEEANLPHRNATLQRWSRKTKSTSALPDRGLINKSARQATIMDALQEHLADRSRLLKRAHTPRSCAPLQLAAKVVEDPKIYDDADFYGLLLKELLELKSGQDSLRTADIDLSNFSLMREAKARKNVDTKASKGRKLRYTVHEKLQNFMAPEDRSKWGERQTDDLFGSLFGQRLGLGEEREVDEVRVDGEAEEEMGLKLFRS